MPRKSLNDGEEQTREFGNGRGMQTAQPIEQRDNGSEIVGLRIGAQKRKYLNRRDTNNEQKVTKQTLLP